MKKYLNIIDVIAIIRELKNQLINSFIDKVYRVEESILFRLRCEVEKYFLIISKHRIGLTKYITEEGKESISILKKFIERCRIVNIDLLRKFDRVIVFSLHDNSKLIFELIEPFNVVYIDDKNVIKWCFKYYEGKDRKVRIGLNYIPPPKQFLNPIDCSLEAYLSSIELGSNFIKSSARVLGVGTEIIQEACKRLSIDQVNYEEQAIEVLYKIREIFNEVLYQELRPRIYIDDNGKLVSVTPIKFEIYEDKFNKIEFRTFNEAVDEYFHRLEIEEVKRSKIESYENELRKIDKVIEDLRNRISEYEIEVKETKLKAETLLNYKYVIEDFLNLIRKYYVEYKDEFTEFIKGLTYENISVLNYDPVKKIILVDINNVKLTIPINIRNIGSLINEYFNKAKDLQNKLNTAKLKLEEFLKKREEVLQNLNTIKAKVEESVIKIEYGVKSWFEKFKWFITSNNIPVLAGKDANQNEVLVRRYLRDWDYFFHADIPGGAVVIAKISNSNKDYTLSEIDVKEIATYAACNSKAWILGLSTIDVYYVKGDQVSKEAPAGEYLSKGSFMIYGKRNWIRNVKLELGIGIRFDRIENTVITRIISAPASCIKRLCNYYVILEPGNLDKNRVAKEIKELFANKIDSEHKKFVKKLPIELIIEHIPGSSRILEFLEGEALDWKIIEKVFQL